MNEATGRVVGLILTLIIATMLKEIYSLSVILLFFIAIVVAIRDATRHIIKGDYNWMHDMFRNVIVGGICGSLIVGILNIMLKRSVFRGMFEGMFAGAIFVGLALGGIALGNTNSLGLRSKGRIVALSALTAFIFFFIEYIDYESTGSFDYESFFIISLPILGVGYNSSYIISSELLRKSKKYSWSFSKGYSWIGVAIGLVAGSIVAILSPYVGYLPFFQGYLDLLGNVEYLEINYYLNIISGIIFLVGIAFAVRNSAKGDVHNWMRGMFIGALVGGIAGVIIGPIINGILGDVYGYGIADKIIIVAIIWSAIVGGISGGIIGGTAGGGIGGTVTSGLFITTIAIDIPEAFPLFIIPIFVSIGYFIGRHFGNLAENKRLELQRLAEERRETERREREHLEKERLLEEEKMMQLESMKKEILDKIYEVTKK